MAFVKKAKKYIKKQAKRAYGYAKKRYAPDGHINLHAIARDLNTIKGVINSEQRFFDFNVGGAGTALGQFTGNGQGGIYVDVTPYPVQGNTDITRSGDSIRPTMANLRIQLSQQSATVNPIRVRILMLKNNGSNVSASTAVSTYFDPGPFNSNSVYDYYSEKNKDYKGNIVKIFEKRVIVNEAVSSQTGIKDFTMNVKMSKDYHTYFVNNSTTVGRGQIYLIMLCDNGNCSNATACTDTSAVIGSTAINTGLIARYSLRWHFYDN